MARRHARLFALLVVMALAVPVSQVLAQDKEDRVQGTVNLVNKDTKTIVVTSEAGKDQKQVVYNDATKVTRDNNPATLDDVQNGRRVICLGKLNDRGQLVARAIEVRPAS